MAGRDQWPDESRMLRRRDRMPGVFAAVIGLLGVGVLLVGATQVVGSEQVVGIPGPQSGGYLVAAHQAPDPVVQGLGHEPVAVTTPSATTSAAPPPTTAPATTAAPPSSSSRPAPVQGSQLPNTIRLPRGGTAYLLRGQVAADGSLPIPSGVNQAVWWGTGLAAGAGATVFAGHVNWGGVTGPFAELWHDNPGDIVSIKDDAGGQWRFQVTQVLTLSKDQLPQQAPTLFAPTGPRRIVLATCGGEWVGGTLGYADNRVVVAIPFN
jgi:hypothetical protein